MECIESKNKEVRWGGQRDSKFQNDDNAVIGADEAPARHVARSTTVCVCVKTETSLIPA